MAQAGLELEILLLQPPQGCSYRHSSSHLSSLEHCLREHYTAWELLRQGVVRKRLKILIMGRRDHE